MYCLYSLKKFFIHGCKWLLCDSSDVNHPNILLGGGCRCYSYIGQKKILSVVIWIWIVVIQMFKVYKWNLKVGLYFTCCEFVTLITQQAHPQDLPPLVRLGGTLKESRRLPVSLLAICLSECVSMFASVPVRVYVCPVYPVCLVCRSVPLLYVFLASSVPSSIGFAIQTESSGRGVAWTFNTESEVCPRLRGSASAQPKLDHIFTLKEKCF